MRRVLLLSAATILPAACDTTTPPDPRRASLAPVSSPARVVALVPVTPPIRFTRDRGKPVTERRVIPTKGFRAPFRLTVENGPPGERVSSAVVRVDGREVVGPNDFGQNAAEPTVVELTPGSEITIEVEIRSAPVSSLTVTLDAQRAVTRFCPTDAPGSAHVTLQSALAATDPGGTIVVCDGVHSVNAVIDRPVDIVAENPGQATLTNSVNAPLLFVSAVDAGTVRIADLNLDAPIIGILVVQRYDRVIIENNRIRSIASSATALTQGIQVSSSTANPTGSAVTLRQNRVEGFREGIVMFGGHVGITDNVIERSILNAITWRVFTGNNSTGTITANTFAQCGVNACIDVGHFGPTPVEVTDNQVDNDIARNTGRTITVQGRVNVRRNRVTGTGGTGLQLPLGSQSFAVRAGAIAAGGTAGFTPVIEGNRISNATFGIEMFTTLSGIVVTDNTITLVMWPFAVVPGGLAHDKRVERNDLSQYAGAINPPSILVGSFRCNWWGSPDGPAPAFFPVLPSTSLWTPFSTEPIANRPEVACSPGS
jgi:parallel beta-helix repeat protein